MTASIVLLFAAAVVLAHAGSPGTFLSAYRSDEASHLKKP